MAQADIDAVSINPTIHLHTGFVYIAMDLTGPGACSMYLNAFYPNAPTGLDAPLPPAPPLPEDFLPQYQPYNDKQLTWGGWADLTWTPDGLITKKLICPCEDSKNADRGCFISP